MANKKHYLIPVSKLNLYVKTVLKRSVNKQESLLEAVIEALKTEGVYTEFEKLGKRKTIEQHRKHVLQRIQGIVKEPSKEKAVYKTDESSVDFLQSYAWRRLRMEALKLHKARCQCCGASPATGAVMNVDHIKPRKLFPELSLCLDNLQILCAPCNHGKGNWDTTDWRCIDG